jgi:hypothetical protein
MKADTARSPPSGDVFHGQGTRSVARTIVAVDGDDVGTSGVESRKAPSSVAG